MLVSDLITLVREDYLDDTLGVDTNDSLVSEESLVRFANDAQKESCRRMDMLYDQDTAAICEIDFLTDGAALALDSRIVKLERVMLDGVELTKKTEQEIKAGNAAWMTYTNTPTSYYVKQRKIYLHPIPVVVGTLDLAVYRLPVDEITATTDSFVIPEEFQLDLINWMLFRVYNLRDEDLYDPKNAAFYSDQFTQDFGPTVPADVRLHMLESPKTQTLRPTTGYSYTNNDQSDPDFDSTGWS
jgi:hypothetical protein